MHISVSIINCMRIMLLILHTVVENCNLSTQAHKRVINNFSIINMISLGYFLLIVRQCITEVVAADAF